MKIALNNRGIKRIISDDGNCIRCMFKKNKPHCTPAALDLCTTADVCYTLHLDKSKNSIFFI